MSGARPSIDRLRNYLNELTPEARALLVAELEREGLRGAGDSAFGFVLDELRGSLRGRGTSQPRIGNPSRIFFRPLEPFLINENSAQKVRGRVPRAALTPMWVWITRDLVPREARSYNEEAGSALAMNDVDGAQRLAKAFQDQVLLHARDALALVDRDEESRRKLAALLGSPRNLEEMRDALAIMRSRDALGVIASRLPLVVKNLADEALENARLVLESPVARHPQVFPYALVLLMGRLSHPWQIVRLAVKAADTDIAAKIAETPYAAAVNLAFAEMERLTILLASAMKSPNAARVGYCIKDIHDYARGFRTEMDLTADSAWARRLGALRKEASSLLEPQIAAVTGNIRRILKARRPAGADAGMTVDAEDVRLAEASIDLLLAARPYASELALNEVTQRAMTELQTMLDGGTPAMIEGVRSAGEADKTFRLSQVEAAVRFSAKVFGQQYAQLLAKSVEVAIHGDRRPAKA